MKTHHLPLLLLLSLLPPPPATAAAAPSNITAVFAFGDSTLDPGNNNYLKTIFRADHPPYGRDFPGHSPTGRFTDGKLMTDFLVGAMGLKKDGILKAYLSPSISSDDLATGVSFASAGTGLDVVTSSLSNVASMDAQVGYFKEYLGKVGLTAAQVGEALFVIGAGSNDMMFNYYTLPTRRSMGLDGYHALLLQNLQSFVKQLYNMGARKFSIAGLPPIGCLPVQITAGNILPPRVPPQKGCVAEQNTDSEAYNKKLQTLFGALSASMAGSKVVYVDIYTPLLDMVTNPNKYGFEETGRGCCGTGLIEMGPTCDSIMPTCADASKYLFWDAVHPSQAAYNALATEFAKTVLPHLIN
ncbi:GDSL esterase/lipase [Acorus gramineus]|uniref:GDSL esterase/lipase n=1 Tax=Acorus gramineus TaxID=55184 RepID=A0AAV9B572_ACOGR|nr:GDSL esterase/lipase [Acorus gramineus]